MFFIPWIFFSYPYTTISYLVKSVFVSYCAFHFIPSTSISYSEHGISYQVAKFPYPTQPISYSSHFPLISLPATLYVHSFTTERSSHLLGCFLWPNYVAQSSSSPTGWLWPAPTAPTCQASDALSPGSQAWSRLVSVLHAWTANSGAHTSSCVCTTSERRRHSLRPADHNRACTPPYSKF